VNLVEKDGITRVLFARPTVIAAGSPGIAVIEEIEQVISTALRAGVAAAEAR
jgi:DNA replicative helicase MCM subunit Mcm2 (Cdc46/Mcm family)